MYTQTQGLLSTCGADCFHSSDGARAIDVGDKDKVCLSRDDRQCHMGKACSQAPPLECNWRGISPVAFLLLSPHCDRHVYCILKEHIAQSRTHPGPVITPSSTVSTAQHEAAWLHCFVRLHPQPSHLSEPRSNPLTACRRNEQCLSPHI
jgi:hypothetical protein